MARHRRSRGPGPSEGCWQARVRGSRGRQECGRLVSKFRVRLVPQGGASHAHARAHGRARVRAHARTHTNTRTRARASARACARSSVRAQPRKSALVRARGDHSFLAAKVYKQ